MEPEAVVLAEDEVLLEVAEVEDLEEVEVVVVVVPLKVDVPPVVDEEDEEPLEEAELETEGRGEAVLMGTPTG